MLNRTYAYDMEDRILDIRSLEIIIMAGLEPHLTYRVMEISHLFF